MTIAWFVFSVIMGIIEGVTAQLVSIWFVIGGLAACITSIFTDNIWIQLAVFAAVTLIALIATRPFVKKITKFDKEKTNSDKNIGKSATVIKDINNELAIGQVSVNGVVWSARSTDGSIIEKDSIVKVVSIEGVKLMVEPIKQVVGAI